MEFLYLREAKKNFVVKLYSIVELVLHKVPLTLLLPSIEAIHPPSPDQMILVAFETTLKARSIYEVNTTVISEEITMKTLEDLKAENFVVKERLDKMDEMFKRQDEKTTRIEGMLGAILSRLSPPP